VLQSTEAKKIKPLIPPRKNSGLWEMGHPRNEAVTAFKAGELNQWKVNTGYHDRSLSETAMYRYKTLTSGTLSLRCYNAQVDETYANVKANNKVIRLGMPKETVVFIFPTRMEMIKLLVDLINNAVVVLYKYLVQRCLSIISVSIALHCLL